MAASSSILPSTAHPLPNPTPNPDSDPKTYIRQGYDRIAPKYHAWASPRIVPARTAYIEKLLSLLPEPEIPPPLSSSTPNSLTLLELGCGSGVPCTQTFTFHPQFHVTAVDISAAQIALAREHLLPNEENITLIHSDMTQLSFPPSSFSAVVAFYSLFHLPTLEQESMLRKIATWLRPAGVFLANFQVEEKEVVREDWFEKGVRMFSCGLGVRGTRKMVEEGGLVVLEDEVKGEKVGSQEVMFQWVLARKG